MELLLAARVSSYLGPRSRIYRELDRAPTESSLKPPTTTGPQTSAQPDRAEEQTVAQSLPALKDHDKEVDKPVLYIFAQRKLRGLPSSWII